jgi:hypothetical protein
MTLREIKEILKAEIICGEEHLDIEIEFAGGSDLMSDVLAFGKPGLEKEIPLLSTHHMMYTACALLFNQGLPGVRSSSNQK